MPPGADTAVRNTSEAKDDEPKEKSCNRLEYVNLHAECHAAHHGRSYDACGEDTCACKPSGSRLGWSRDGAVVRRAITTTRHRGNECD